MTWAAPNMSFQSFVVGNSNQAAFAALVEPAPGLVYVFGGPGRGKTHLLRAAAAAGGVEYLTVEDVLNAVIDALRGEHLEAYREEFASRRLVVVDDIETLRARPHAQAEINGLIGAVVRAGGVVVLAGPAHPRHLDWLIADLRLTLQSGRTVELAAIDIETGAELARRRGAALGVEVPDDMASAAAEARCPNAIFEAIGRAALTARLNGKAFELCG